MFRQKLSNAEIPNLPAGSNLKVMTYSDILEEKALIWVIIE